MTECTTGCLCEEIDVSIHSRDVGIEAACDKRGSDGVEELTTLP
jgi:hypothetical protein